MGIVAMVVGVSASSLCAQVTPIRSSVESDTDIYITQSDFSDHPNIIDEQLATNNSLFADADAAMNNEHGIFSGRTMTEMNFTGVDSGEFDAQLEFVGSQSGGAPAVGGYGHTLTGEFLYEFTLPADGDVQFSGTLINTDTALEAFVNISVGSYTAAGTFQGTFFNGQVLDTANLGTVPFDFDVPLAPTSGRYVLRIVLGHSSLGTRTQPEISSFLNCSFLINGPDVCPADLTGDGILNFFDISAFLSAFAAMDPAADMNGDGVWNFFDVSAFLAAFGAGCP